MTRDQIEKMFRSATGMNKEGQERRMRRFADAIVAEWSATAKTDGNMKTTLPAYKQAIQIREVTADSVTVELPGENVADAAPNVAMIARMLEFGMGPGGIGTSGPYDVRDFLLTGRTSVNVPFRQKTKMIEELGKIKNGGMGASKTLQAARSLSATRVTGGSWQGEQLASGYTRIVHNPNTKVPHTTDRLSGLRRMVGKDTQTSRYITFRKATRNQPAGKWIHRGIQARHLAEKVQAKLPDLWRMIS